MSLFFILHGWIPSGQTSYFHVINCSGILGSTLPKSWSTTMDLGKIPEISRLKKLRLPTPFGYWVNPSLGQKMSIVNKLSMAKIHQEVRRTDLKVCPPHEGPRIWGIVFQFVRLLIENLPS